MSTNAPDARSLVRSLVAKSEDAAGEAYAMHSACERTLRRLTRSIGTVGSRALMSRALRDARKDFPILDAITLASPPAQSLEGMSAIVEAHGAPGAARALESLLAGMLGLMGRLIGDDLVGQLVRQLETEDTQDNEDGA